MIVGRTYLERGRPVVVLVRWGAVTPPGRADQLRLELADEMMWRWRVRGQLVGGKLSGGGPRNVLIRRETGELVVRPFRGLRRPR